MIIEAGMPASNGWGTKPVGLSCLQRRDDLATVPSLSVYQHFGKNATNKASQIHLNFDIRRQEFCSFNAFPCFFIFAVFATDAACAHFVDKRPATAPFFVEAHASLAVAAVP